MNYSRKRKKHRLKNFILKTISYIMGLVFILGACALDSEGTNIPFLMVVVSMMWLIPFGYANGFFETEGDEDEPHEQLPKRRHY